MMYLLCGFIGFWFGFGVSALMCAASKGSISGWENSCTGDCRQGRDCNCGVKK